MLASHSIWQNIRSSVWLIGGVGCLFGALIFWAITDKSKLVEVSEPIEEVQVQIQPEKVAASTDLGVLSDEVRPLETTTRVVASGNHDPEFRGTRFIEDNQKSWTIELFRATEEDVIKSFLLRQSERKNFIYFRLSGENQAEQYVLAYGLFKKQADFKPLMDQLNVKLPGSVRPQVRQLKQYVSLVNDLGSEEMGNHQKIYEINLRNAPLPVIDESVLAQIRAAPTIVTEAVRAKPAPAPATTPAAKPAPVVDAPKAKTEPKPSVSHSPDKPAAPRNHDSIDPFN
ncbi:hypothetical protein [Acinetobacter rudis]|uniref:hypothetical protein n=1 Tax=Acinetobacter rudis TaxID=632955 RepID=UPI0033428966